MTNDAVLEFRSLQPAGTIRTFSGRYVNPLALLPEDMDLVDMAHALARIQRYGGHLPMDWSVAEHSLLVADLVVAMGAARFELDALIHDAAEAYLGDMTAPLKGSPAMASYREAEARAYRAIAEHFGTVTEEPTLVKTCDKLALAIEMRDLRGHVDITVPNELRGLYEHTKLVLVKDHRTNYVGVKNFFIARVGRALAARRTGSPIAAGRGADSGSSEPQERKQTP